MQGMRSKLTKNGSQRLFTATAQKMDWRNRLQTIPLRGGIRL